SRFQEARTDPVLRRKRTASRPPSGSIAERNEREAFSNPDVDLRLRLSPPLPYDGPIDVCPQKGSPIVEVVPTTCDAQRCARIARLLPRLRHLTPKLNEQKRRFCSLHRLIAWRIVSAKRVPEIR